MGFGLFSWPVEEAAFSMLCQGTCESVNSVVAVRVGRDLVEQRRVLPHAQNTPHTDLF